MVCNCVILAISKDLWVQKLIEISLKIGKTKLDCIILPYMLTCMQLYVSVIFLAFVFCVICNFSVQSKHGISDVLHALGALPAGFRDSTLAKFKQNGLSGSTDYSSDRFCYVVQFFDLL